MQTEEIKTLSEELKVQRFRQNKSQSDCAELLGVSIPTYRELEYNPNKLTLEQALVLGGYLQWNLVEFFLSIILQNANKIQNDS